MLGKFKNMYQKIPDFLKIYITRVFKLNIYESKFIWNEIEKVDKINELISSKSSSLTKLVNKNLEELLSWAYTCSPYWRKRLSRIKKLDLENIQEIEPIDSQEVANNFDQIIIPRIKGYFTSTGGSGRNPTRVYLSDKSYFLDRAYVLWSWKNNGYKKGDKKVTFRGVNLGKKLFKPNPVFNELLINTFLMNHENIEQIVDQIKKFKATFAHGYPSVLLKFAKLVRDAGLDLRFSGIAFASEAFNEDQRVYIERTFECRAIATYGMTERVGFASEQKNNKGIYTVFPTYGLLEILKKDGTRAKEGESGEIVCTGFLNKAMPLIRYKTGDYATVKTIHNGLYLEIYDLLGRWGKDFIFDNAGMKIPTTAVNIHSTAQFYFKYIQIWQSKRGQITLKLVPWDELEINEIKKRALQIHEAFQNKLLNLVVDIKIVNENEIYISKRGKVPYLVNELSEEESL